MNEKIVENLLQLLQAGGTGAFVLYLVHILSGVVQWLGGLGIVAFVVLKIAKIIQKSVREDNLRMDCQRLVNIVERKIK